MTRSRSGNPAARLGKALRQVLQSTESSVSVTDRHNIVVVRNQAASGGTETVAATQAAPIVQHDGHED